MPTPPVVPFADLVADLKGRIALGRLLPPERPILVACSGGVDSVVLLHLLRFALTDLVGPLRALHVDHAMRPGSGADADWVRGLCAAWEIPLRVVALPHPPLDEAAARRARYAALREEARRFDDALIATAHHADDQAETVLFRAARGAGPAGLVGIRERTRSLVRPLLRHPRARLLEYAARHRLAWREDPTNRDPSFARNAIRAEVLPALERAVPGAAAALARLARLAARDERHWRLAADAVERAARQPAEGGTVLLARPILLSYDRALRARVLRRISARLGARVRGRALDRALTFVSEAPSGRRMDLGGGVSLERAFDTLRLIRRESAANEGPDRAAEAELRISPGSARRGTLRIGRRTLAVEWRPVPADAAEAWDSPPGTGTDTGQAAGFAVTALRYPLQVRAPRPGDRIRFPHGRKRLVRLFAEHGVPRWSRTTWPVLADADGAVVWVPGVAQDRATVPRSGEPVLNVRVWDERDD